MVWVGAIGGGAFVLASLLLGLRMLLLARRTRALPEFSLGLALFLMGAISYPIFVVARLAIDLGDDARIALTLVSQALMLVGTLSLGVFNWRVFRAETSWAPGLITAVAVVFLALLGWQCVQPGLMAFIAENRGPFSASSALVGVTLVWGGVESLRYHAMLAKRVDLGLCDPVVADRIRLWGFAMLSAWSINVFSVIGQAFGIDPATSPAAGAVTGVMGLTATCALWLAFFPPPAYLARFAPDCPPA